MLREVRHLVKKITLLGHPRLLELGSSKLLVARGSPARKSFASAGLGLPLSAGQQGQKDPDLQGDVHRRKSRAIRRIVTVFVFVKAVARINDGSITVYVDDLRPQRSEAGEGGGRFKRMICAGPMTS